MRPSGPRALLALAAFGLLSGSVLAADKFGADKFAAPPPAPPGVSIPADEPAVLGRLRTLLGPSLTLAYRAATPEADGIWLEGLELTGLIGTLTAAEARFTGVTDRAIGGIVARDLGLTTPNGDSVGLAGLELGNLVTDPATPSRLTLDRLRLETLALRGSTELGLAELTLESFGGGRPGRLSLSGLDVLERGSAMADRLQIGRLSLGGLDLAAALMAIGAGELPGRGDQEPYRFELAAVTLSQAGAPFGALDSLVLTGEPGGEQGKVETTRLALQGLRIEAGSVPLPVLQLYGYDALVIDATTESRLDRAAGTLDTPALALGLRGIGAIGLSYRLSGVSIESAQALDFAAWRLEALTLRVADQSLYGRMLRDEARRGRVSEAKVRERYLAEATRALGGEREGGALLAAVWKFLRGEATEVELTLKPPQPVSLEAAQQALALGPASAQRRLGLTAVAR